MVSYLSTNLTMGSTILYLRSNNKLKRGCCFVLSTRSLHDKLGSYNQMCSHCIYIKQKKICFGEVVLSWEIDLNPGKVKKIKGREKSNAIFSIIMMFMIIRMFLSIPMEYSISLDKFWLMIFVKLFRNLNFVIGVDPA